MARDWIWVTVEVATAAHAEQLVEHGGAEGLSGTQLLKGAMDRPEKFADFGAPDVAALAAAYAYGFARNHAFTAGNKRTAAVVSETFLLLNGHGLGASDAELAVAFLALAAGELSEEEMADWFRQHLRGA